MVRQRRRRQPARVTRRVGNGCERALARRPPLPFIGQFPGAIRGERELRRITRGREHRPGLLRHARRGHAGILDAEEGLIAVREVVEAPLRPDREINRNQRRDLAEPRREVPHLRRGGVERPNPLPRAIQKKILAHIFRGELRHRRLIKRPACDRAAHRLGGRVAIRVKRRLIRAVELRRRPLPPRPAVVRAGPAEVDLLPDPEADVVDEHQPAARLKREGERIAQAQRPDGAVLARGRREKRIVRRDRAVGIKAQDFPQHRLHGGRVGGTQVVADGDEELPVRTEMQRAGVVLGRFTERGEILQHHFAARQREVAARGEAADAVVKGGRAGGVINVHPAVVREVGIERDPRQPALLKPNRVHREKRRGREHAVLAEPHAAGLLADEQPAIRREGHARGRRDLAGPQQLFLAEAGGQLRLRVRGPQPRGQAPSGPQEASRPTS